MALAGFEDDIAAAASIAARRAATRDEFLPSKRHAAVAAVSGFYFDPCLINKHTCE